MLKPLRHMAFCCFGRAFPGLFLLHKKIFFKKIQKLFPKTDFGTSPMMKRFKAAGWRIPKIGMNPYR